MKAAACVARDGVLYVQKKKKDNNISVQGLIMRIVVEELELISSLDI